MNPMPELKPHACGAELVVPIKGELADEGWTYTDFVIERSEVTARYVERCLHGLGWSRSQSKYLANSLLQGARSWLKSPA